MGINFQKSGIFFSTNVDGGTQQAIKDLLGVYADVGQGNYLGLPSLIGRSKKAVFSFLKERLWKRIQSWGTKLLSRAGKVILLKNVAQAIPSYCMSCFLIPKSLCKEMERMMNGFWWSSSNNLKKGVKWLAWENMSMQKANGGLGFRDLYGFNLALLGKHCWNFLNNPSSLVARVYKARYFPNCSLLKAVRGGGCSYLWSGIWQANEVFKDGFRWVVGDGADIEVFNDAWLRAKNNFRVDDSYTNRNSTLKVCDLFVSGERRWDAQKVNDSLSSCDASAVLAIPIPIHQCKDRIAWVHAVNGKYSVKTGYKSWQEIHGTNIRVVESKGWSKLWKADVPNKIKVFLWRFCRNNIPVRLLLRGRGVQTTMLCSMCNDIEHMFHLFFDCPFAVQCWKHMGLQISMENEEYASEGLLKFISCTTQDVLVQVAMTLWGIWRARNLRVWENKVITPNFAMGWASNQVTEWRNAKMKYSRAGISQRVAESRDDCKWVAPVSGELKVNVDASLHNGGVSFATGMVLRDHMGSFIQARTARTGGLVSVIEAEARGVLEALLWVQEMNLAGKKVVVECDSQLIVSAILQGIEYNLEVGNVINDCRMILNSMPEVVISFVKRQANGVAHLLARVPCMVNCSQVFMSPPPSVLESVVREFCLS